MDTLFKKLCLLLIQHDENILLFIKIRYISLKSFIFTLNGFVLTNYIGKIIRVIQFHQFLMYLRLRSDCMCVHFSRLTMGFMLEKTTKEQITQKHTHTWFILR